MSDVLCTICGETKVESEFYLNLGIRRSPCKTCMVVVGRRAKLRSRYQLTEQAFFDLVEKQNGVCAICGGLNGDGKNLSVDHDHSCCPGERSCGACVRGLVCNACNRMLGFAKDSPDILRSALRYLRG